MRALFKVFNLSDNKQQRWKKKYIRLPITRTLANSNQNRFPVDFLQIFTVILPSVTWTLVNWNLPLTWSNFCFPSDNSYNYNFTRDNSNHVLYAHWSRKKLYCSWKHWIYFNTNQVFVVLLLKISVSWSDHEVCMILAFVPRAVHSGGQGAGGGGRCPRQEN